MTQAVTQVVVLEFDEQLRGALHDVLTLYNHYAVTDLVEVTAGIDCLAATPGGMVVVVSNRDMDHHMSVAFFAAVAANEQIAQRHRYILLSTDPLRIPEGLQTHLAHLNARILVKPFDIDALLDAVRQAAASLTPLPAPARDSQRTAARAHELANHIE
jgi:hypothetical protein